MKLFTAIASAAVIGSSFLLITPAKAGCSPGVWISDYETMLKGGASYSVVNSALNENRTAFSGTGCLYQWKGYANDNQSRYPLFYKFIQTVNYK